MLIYLVVAICVVGLITNVAATAVKIQVNARLPKGEQFSWWAHYSSDVGRKHRELFPGSPLPGIARYGWWICLLLMGAMILVGVLK